MAVTPPPSTATESASPPPGIATPSPVSSDAANSASSPPPTKSSIPMIVGIAAAVIVVGLALTIVWRRGHSAGMKRAAAADASRDTAGGDSSRDANSQNKVSLWQDDDLLALKVSVDDIQDVRKLGSGAFADVWLVQFRRVMLLTAKRLHANACTRQQTHDFIHEIKLVAPLKHPNIVELQHVAWVSESDLQALFEYMDGGDLRTYLVDLKTPTHWTTAKVQFAIDIVEALVYVHSFMPPLVHRDLKSRNVLLGHCSSHESGLRAKLTDFGVSRYRSVQHTMTAGVGTGRWLAPEVIAGADDYGTPADIYSFGVVLFELDTHEIPYANEQGTNGKQLQDVAILQRVAEGQLTPTMGANCLPQISELARACFTHDPAKRPTAPELAYALRTLQKSFNDVEYVD